MNTIDIAVLSLMGVGILLILMGIYLGEIMTAINVISKFIYGKLTRKKGG